MRDFPASWRPQKTCLTPFSMLFPILCALVSGSEFQHIDPLRREFCGQMAGLVAEKGGNWLESSSRKASLRGKFLALRATKSRTGEGWGDPCDKSTRALWYGHEGVVVRSRGCHEQFATICWMMDWYVWLLCFVPTAILLPKKRGCAYFDTPSFSMCKRF